MQITLPPHIRSYITEKIESGRFSSEQEVIVDVFEQVMRDYDPMADPRVLDAVAQAERGEAYDITPELRIRIREEVEADFLRGAEIPDDVKY